MISLALRRLRAAPGFAAAVTIMLALGIGATSGVFGVLDAILLRPLPFGEPERLVALTHSLVLSGPSKVDQSDASVLLYQRHATGTFESIGAYRTRDVNVVAPGDGASPPERVAAALVSANLFSTLRVAPARGRGFRPDEDRPGAPAVVVISSALWKRKFGGDPAVIGRRLVIDGAEREVVGIMPEGFRYPSASTSAWIPLALDPLKANPGSFNFQGIGRLKPGVSIASAAAELDRYLPRLLDEFPSDIPREMFAKVQLNPVVTPLRDVVVGDVGRLLWILFAAVGLLLVVACANVASLFVVRAEGAQRDVAVRIALGAGRSAIAKQYLAEALVLSSAGGAIGIVLAALGVRALRASPAGADLPRMAEVGFDARALTFAIGVTAVSALAVSLLPVLRARRVAPGVVLKESSRSATAGRERQRARSILVVAQVALALVLLSGSMLMARSFAELRDVRPGFDPNGVLTLRVALPRATYNTTESEVRLINRLLDELRTIRGVQSAAVTDWLPLTDDHNDSVITLEDQPLPPDVVPPDHPLTYVSRDHFATLGIPLLSGRTLGRADPDHPVGEVLVSRSFAERYWKGQSAIGKRLRANIKGPWSTVVGVVGDVHLSSLDQPAEQMVYFPLISPADDGSGIGNAIAITVRTSGEPSALTSRVREVVHAIDPSLPTYDERPMTTRLADASARTRFVLLMLGVASIVALTIGMVGLYGVLAYGVTLRRREIGVRMALGATVQDVTRMIASRGVALAAVGIAAGMFGAMASTHVLRGLLYGVSPTDPLALAGTCVVLFAVAVIASWLPARQAASIDPMEALRRD